MAQSFDADELWQRIFDDRELLTELRDALVAETPATLQEIGAALAAGDAAGVRAGAHGLKGSLANLAAHQGERLAAQLESSAVAGDISGASAILAALEAQVELVIAELGELAEPGGE